MSKLKGKQLYDSTITQAKLNLTYPIYDYDAATKYYVDNIFISAVTLNTNQIITGSKTFSNPVIMLNGLTVSGTTTFVNTQNLNISDNLILINSGETGSGVTLRYAGIEIDRGTSPKYGFYFDEGTQTFRVGQTGLTQAVATREDSPITGNIATWDGTNFRFNTTLSQASFLSANTSGNFLSANTSFYTQAQANANFLSANTNFSQYSTTGTTQNISARKTFTSGITISGSTFIITPSRTIATSGVTGTIGEIAWDSNYIYVCVATNRWKRSAIASW